MPQRGPIEILQAHREELEALGVASLDLFGSHARGEAGPESDVDLLVRFRERVTFQRYMQLQLALEQWLGRRVDLVTEASLAMKPRARERVMRELLRVA
ncbi:MAG: hypothetical protein RIT45_1462 [Pseudomonadota bacterium]